MADDQQQTHDEELTRRTKRARAQLNLWIASKGTHHSTPSLISLEFARTSHPCASQVALRCFRFLNPLENQKRRNPARWRGEFFERFLINDDCSISAPGFATRTGNRAARVSTRPRPTPLVEAVDAHAAEMSFQRKYAESSGWDFLTSFFILLIFEQKTTMD